MLSIQSLFQGAMQIFPLKCIKTEIFKLELSVGPPAALL